MCSALSGITSVPVVAIVKEEEKPEPVEPEKMLGVDEFATKYFCGPVFLSDAERTLYEYLGNAPIFTFGTLGKMLLNPLKARREMKQMGERMKEKGVEGNMVGDGLVKGGVFCVAPTGELRYLFREDPGNGIPSEAQQQIVEAVRSFETLRGVVAPTGAAASASTVEAE